MDYNQEALYSAMFGANHVDLAEPYFTFIAQAVASGGPAAESAALGCPGGLHLSVDLAPFGLKMGVFGEPQDWGIRSNAAYAAMPFILYYYSTPLNATWVNTVALPYLTGVAKYWACALIKVPVPGAPDGYQYWDANDCNGDEGCSLPPADRTNPMWGIVYITRLFNTVLDMAAATGTPTPPAWADIAAHLPPIPTTMYSPSRGAPAVPVLAWYGNSSFTNMGGQSNNLHAIYPSELLDMGDPNATLVAAALNSFKFTAWTQSNSFNWVYSAAARIGLPPEQWLPRLRAQVASLVHPNGLIAWGGACSDTLGTMQAVTDALVQCAPRDRVIRVFPAWPGNESAAFTTLRVRGAFLVSGTYVGAPQWAGAVAGSTGGTANVSIVSEAGGSVTVLSPWPATPPTGVLVCDVTGGGGGGAGGCPSGAPVSGVTWGTVPGPAGGPSATWSTGAGRAYWMGLTSPIRLVATSAATA
jgi:hypothetical protein